LFLNIAVSTTDDIVAVWEKGLLMAIGALAESNIAAIFILLVSQNATYSCNVSIANAMKNGMDIAPDVKLTNNV